MEGRLRVSLPNGTRGPVMRLRIKGTTYYGQFYGHSSKNKKVILFMDEETNKVKKIPMSRLEIVPDKW